MRMYDLILKKRNGNELSLDEIHFIIDGYVKGEIPDYQMSAFLMAVYYKGMTKEETVNLTLEMARSGDMLDLSNIEGVKVDKHSTGGIGDKTTLVLGPMVASCNIPVAKMSGRGLGHTGGTIDKLESIPGFTTSMEVKDFENQVNSIKFALTGQTGNLAPADKKIYALRDVTATVDSIPLIASSIMSKKIASGANAIVLDVKVGSGAFMKNLQDAKELAKTMVDIGNGAGRKTIAVISDMDQPLGLAVGNALEVIEAIDVLKGNGPKDVRDLCVTLGANMLMCADNSLDNATAVDMMEKSIDSGAALDKFKEFVNMQGGDSNIADDYNILPTAKYIYEVQSVKEGYISNIDAQEIGMASLILGAGREKKGDDIDFAVGLVLTKKINDYVKKGDVICKIYANDEAKINASKERLLASYSFSEQKIESHKLIYEIIV